MPRLLGLEHLTLLGVTPPEFVALAASAGFTAVGLRAAPATGDEPAWPMTPGSPMLAETARRCAQYGITVLDVEAIRLGPAPADHDKILADHEKILQAAAELNARYVNALCEDPDLSRLADSFAALTALAKPYHVRPLIEFMAYRPVRTLADAVAIAAGSDGGGLLIDALHVQRCGIRLAELTELTQVDAALIGYLQLCDAPLQAPPDQLREARHARLLPGRGELPLRDLVAALPPGIPAAIEAPGAIRAFTDEAETAWQTLYDTVTPC
jgi:sugar phosphate isomerase/epimerase